MLKEFLFVDKNDGSKTKVLASCFDFAYLIFTIEYGLYEINSCVEYEFGKYIVDITEKNI